MTKTLDVIVAGMRCAGSQTAMPQARKGYRVPAVDRATGRLLSRVVSACGG